MSEFDLLGTAADGMTLQRGLLDLAARNVAAAQASTPQHPYARIVAELPPPDAPPSGDGAAFEPPDRASEADEGDEAIESPAPRLRTVRSGETADALTEMIAVLDAQRAYEANASVFDVGKRLAERTIDVGRPS